MSRQRPARVRNCAVFGFVLLSGLFSSCQAIETRHEADSYYEQGGMWCANYGIGVEGARVAVIAALTHLQMPVYREGPLRHGIFLDTRTPENCEARVFIVSLGRHGAGTRVSVRIGGFGTHRAICARLLDEITQDLQAGRQADITPTAFVPPPPTVTPATVPIPAGQHPLSSPESNLPPQPVPVEK
jgi:hypothetical protein